MWYAVAFSFATKALSSSTTVLETSSHVGPMAGVSQSRGGYDRGYGGGRGLCVSLGGRIHGAMA